MSSRTDLDWLCDHLDRHFGQALESAPDALRQWSLWLARNEARCIGFRARTLGELRFVPSGEKQSTLIELKLFGLTQRGTDTELLHWAQWQGELHKDNPDMQLAQRLQDEYRDLKQKADQHDLAKG